MSESKSGATFLASIIPPLALLIVYWQTHDALCILLTLALCYTIIPLIYDNLVYNLRWEFKYGPEMTKWKTKSIEFFIMIFLGALLSTGMWFLTYASGIFEIEVEVTPLTYTTPNFPGYLYYILVLLMFLFVVPVTEELFWRGFIQQDQFLGSILGVLMYVVLNHIKFMFVYPQRGWWIIALDVMFFIAGGVQNVLGKKGIIGSSGFSIGLSFGWLLRIIILGRIGGESLSSSRGALKEPSLFLLHDW